jgi:TupA-like ATPgrasp
MAPGANSPNHPLSLRIVKSAQIIELLQGAKRRIGRACFPVTIRLKWLHDKRHLPLTPEHWELYDIIHRRCWEGLSKFPNLIDCRDFNDKIQWLKLFDQSEEIVRCSDKVLVRDHVRDRVGDRYLVKMYQVHKHFSEIDFCALPDAFVIKTNHNSGTVILVRDKSSLDRRAAEERIEAALAKPYGWLNGEWGYSYVEPRVLVEELIDPRSFKQPPDYKFYCVEGVVKFCHYIYDRGFDTKEQTVDPAGNDLATELYPSFKLGTDFKKPGLWGEMIHVAEQLGKGFKCVRVDLFCTGDRVYAGEMTFWPMAGLYKGEGQKSIGKFLDFDRSTYKPFLIPDLERRRSRFGFYPHRSPSCRA